MFTSRFPLALKTLYLHAAKACSKVTTHKLTTKKLKTYFRMSAGQLEFLLAELGPHLRGQRNHFRDLIDQERHLAVRLR